MGFPTLSAKEAEILRLLSGGRELYGLEMVKLANGELKRGTIYTTLNRMDDKGLVTSRSEERTPEAAGLPRRLYRITALGQRTLVALEDAAARVAQLRPAEAV